MNFGLYVFVVGILCGKGIYGQGQRSCDPDAFQQCFKDLVATSLLAVEESASPEACSERNFTSFRECSINHLEGCTSYFGGVMVSAVRPYVHLLDTVHQRACSKEYEFGDCDLTTAKTCMNEFFRTISSVGVARTCKQSYLTHQCLQPALDACSDLHRYLVAMVMDEMKLTSDLLCHPDSCNVDIAAQLLTEGMRSIGYPATVVRQSALVCRELWSALALVTNQTAECLQSELPPSLWQSYRLLYQFATDYCGAPADDYMLTNVPSDLLMSVYLATVGTSEWTSRDNMCRLFNTTLLQAAHHNQHSAIYSEHMFTWRYTMEFNLDKYGTACLNRQMFDCDWVERVADGFGECHFGAAEACLDMVLLSKLVVEVNLQRTSWQTVCAAAYNMLACHQYYTGRCLFTSTPNMATMQEIESLVGYECSQLGQFDRPDRCDHPPPACDVSRAVSECERLAWEESDVCEHKEAMLACFREHTAGCSSAQASVAQFYMEWLLHECSHNYTILAEDTLRAASQCRVQQGYNILTGLFMSYDLSWIVCAAGSLFEQCISDKTVPSLAMLYGNQYSEFSSQFNAAVCNLTRINTSPLPQGLIEPPECNIEMVAGEITLVTQMMSDFPFLSVIDQTKICGIVPVWLQTVPDRMVNCSRQRQVLLSDVFVYVTNMHAFYCPSPRKVEEGACDIARVQMCLEDFGRYAYFANPDGDHCGKLQETYDCLYQHSQSCDNATLESLVREVRAIRSLIGDMTCREPDWCRPSGSQPIDSLWIREVCRPQQSCLMFGWEECVNEYGLSKFCSNATEVVTCIQDKLSGCDAEQYLVAKYNMMGYINTVLPQLGSCTFSVTDPAFITQADLALLQCSSVFENNFVLKDNLCYSLNYYLQCVGAVDMSELSYVWRAVHDSNVQMWIKEAYISCQINVDENFVVSPEFNRDDYTGSECNDAGIPCLQSLIKKAVSGFYIVPLDQRQTEFCQTFESDTACVIQRTSGCVDAGERSMLTSAVWLGKALDNIGVCTVGTVKPRACNPEAAMDCVSDLGLDLAKNIHSGPTNTVCLKALTAHECVNQYSSSCDFHTRSKVEKTFSQVETLVRYFCTTPPVSTEDTCASQGPAQCDVERGLVCFVPTQSLILQQAATVDQDCSTIPAMKLCVQHYTAGCDEATREMLTGRQLRLSARLNHQCPQMFCEECRARACLRSLYQKIQYEDVYICNVISETKQCIHDNAQYCDESVGGVLLQELELIAGEDSRLCEITLPACLQKFTLSAMQIMSFTTPGTLQTDQAYQNVTAGVPSPTAGVTSLYQQDLGALCHDANKAYFCLDHHLSTLNSSRQPVLVQTLHKIGDVVYEKCQGAQLQCYSCVNATSNEECNSMPVQTCAPNMQACGTVVSNNHYLSKGCVSPDVCQSGCYGNTCSFCCQDDLCNQPWNNVLTEPSSCQPLSALWCGLQLLSTSTQSTTNQTYDCSSLGDSISCMIENTRDCLSYKTTPMGILGRQLLAGDTVGACLDRNPTCDCGQCTSLLLMTLVTSPYADTDRFCSSVQSLYRKTVTEMDFLECDRATLHSTAYNLNNAAYIVQGVCTLNLEESDCVYNGKLYRHGSSFTAVDGCNKCRCGSGQVACTLMLCPPDKPDKDRCPPLRPGDVGICGFMCSNNDDCTGDQICCTTACGGIACTNPEPANVTKCYYNGQVYNRSTSFQSADGCNICVCQETAIACSIFSCPTPDNFTSNATCDLGAAQGCIEEASTNYLLLKQLGLGNDSICSEAADMLNCLEPKIASCPLYVLESVRDAISVNFDEILDTCDIQAILRDYSSGNSGGGGRRNLTLDRPCSVMKGLECFSGTTQNDTCREYQAIVDCVSNYTSGCYTMNMAPVLFTLEKELEQLAEGCEIVIPGPGPGPTLAPTTTPRPVNLTDKDYCSYGNRTWSTGSTFRALDGCNFCYCNVGGIICTELNCPYQGDTPACNVTGVEQCIQDTYMAYMVSMATQDGGWKICMSAVQMLHCVEAQTKTCPQNVATSVQNIVLHHLHQISSVCSIDQILMAYSQNTSHPGNQPGSGDPQCTMEGVRVCLWGSGDNRDICSSQQTSLQCLYNISKHCYSEDMTPTLRTVKQFFQTNSGCQLEMPPYTDKNHCYYGNSVYNVGDNFMALDGCNFCFCGDNGMVGCTKMYCGDPTLHNDTCDIAGVRQCLEQAALPYMVSMGTRETQHICLSAAEMILCVEPKVTGCPSDVLQVIHVSVWSDLNLVRPFCDPDHLNNGTSTGNQTMPDTSKPCQLQDAVNCVRIRQGDTACSSYQSMIDCVYNFTAGCLSVDAVPVLYELQRHLEAASVLCDLVTPLMHMDAAYPVAQCTLMFASSLGHSLNMDYLTTGHRDSICGNLDGYLSCLRTAEVSPLGRMYAASAVQSVSNLVDLCEEYVREQVADVVECHSCHGSASMEQCDSQPTQTCQPHQVCSTGVQLDPYSGVSMVTKGCADLSWCQAMYGCNAHYMTCIHCCWGELCNAADNTTAHITMATTTAPPSTPRTIRPHTTPREMESCDLEPATVFMTAHIIRLINFNFIPLQQRGPICQNFESALSSQIDKLQCLEATEHNVHVIAQWLTNWTSAVCEQMKVDPVDEIRCHESLKCLDDFGNFTDQNTACRMLNKSITCLRNNSAYCTDPVKMSVNRSIQLLVDMDHLICVANPLDKYQEPECVDLQSVTNKSVCNATVAMQCAEHIHKAVNNPFIKKEDLCRLVKVGMKCMQDHTYNCSAEVFYSVAPGAAQVIQLAHQTCPDTWCPSSDRCKLGTARGCLDSLEMRVQEVVASGHVDLETCLSVTRTHHCVMNATEECYALDRQSVTQRFHSLAQILVPLCQAQAASTLQCYTIYNQGIHTLANMDKIAVSNVVENIVMQVISHRLYGNNQAVSMNVTDQYAGVNLPGGMFHGVNLPGGMFYWVNMPGGSFYGVNLPGGMFSSFDANLTGQYGVNLPGGMFSSATGSYGRQNPYIRRRRGVALPGTSSAGSQNTTETGDHSAGDQSATANKTDHSNLGSGFWSDNTTLLHDNQTEATRNGSSNPDGHLPTDEAPEMAQSGAGGGGWADLFRLLSQELSHAEYIDTLTSLVNMTRGDVAALIAPQMLMPYGVHKMEICQSVSQSYQCLHLNMQMMMLPGQQQHMLATSLDLLAGVAMEICSPQQCHSCSGLESDELCNKQPLATCQPLEMCQVRSTEGHISKGCASMLTCEENCQHKRWDKTCFCCHGNMCNKHSGQEQGSCDTQTAVHCVQNMLHMTMMGSFWQNATEVYSTAMCMVTSTSGCHSNAYREIYMSGKKLLALYEAVNCSATYDRSFCDLPGASTLVTLASSPYKTVSSMEMSCRMFHTVLQAYTSNRTNTSCCQDSANVRLSLLSLYVQLDPFCPGLDVRPLCTEQSSSSSCREEVLGWDVVDHVCGSFNLPESRNGSAICNVSGALETCFLPQTVDPVSICPSSAIELEALRECMARHTSGCNVTQKAPILSMMRNLVLTCPLGGLNSDHDDEASNDRESRTERTAISHHDYAILCFRPLKSIGDVLSTSNNVQADLCSLVHSVDHCLKGPLSAGSKMALPGLMNKLADFNSTFCHGVKDTGMREPMEACSPEERVECRVNPCDNINMTTTCPAFRNATCLSDYCGDCNARFVFRDQDVTDICQEAAIVSGCDVDLISASMVQYLNIAMMSPLMDFYEMDYACSADLTMHDLSSEIPSCLAVYSEPFSALLPWIQGQLKYMCYSHAAHRPCVHPQCDVTMATEVINHMGYYLRTWSFDDDIFCQKVRNTLKAVDCVVGSCNSSTLANLEARLSDITAQLYSRCPLVMRQAHCKASNQGPEETGSTRPTPRNSPTRAPDASSNTRPANPGPQETRATTGPLGGQEVEPRPSADASCDVESAKRCLFSAALPAQNSSISSNYCSNLLDGVVRLSECVSWATALCDHDNITQVKAYYHSVLTRYQGPCSLNMTRQLMMRLEAGEIFVPECSYYETHHCVLHLTPGGECGNLEDVSYCVREVSAGCGPSQRYINEGMLRTGVIFMLPERCWPNNTTVDTAGNPVVQCVEGLMGSVAGHLSGNETGPVGVCALLGEFLYCLEAVADNDRVPAPLSGATRQMVEHGVPVLQMICQSIGNEDMTVLEDGPATCSLDKVLAVFKSHTIDAILSPIMTQDGKKYICGYDKDTESWRGTFDDFISSCRDGRQRDLHMVFNLVEVLGRLSGTCMPRPHTCSPGEAVQCIQDLAHRVEQHSSWETDQQDICSSIRLTKLCMQQTSGDCDHHVGASLMATLEPVMCKALVICPAMLDQEKPDTESDLDLPVCLSPAVTSHLKSKVCIPNNAMRCLQSVHDLTEKTLTEDRDDVCRKYSESMECFMTNLSGCDEATTMVVLSFGIRAAQRVGEACPTQIRAFCDGDSQPGCSSEKIHRCFDIVREAAEAMSEEDMCFARERIHQCLSTHAEACPHLTQLFIKTQLFTHLLEAGVNLTESRCNSVTQCAFNYVSYLEQSFVQLQEMVGNAPETMCSSGSKSVTESYECRARISELDCMRNSVNRLPEDVAVFVNATQQYTEAIFSTACTALYGMSEELRGCDGACLECYMQEVRLQSYLPLLWTFVGESEAPGVSDVSYNEEFCRSYGRWNSEVAASEANSTCYQDNALADWHQGYVSGMEGVYDKFCVRPCNTTQADLCLDRFQNATGTDQPCLAYDDARICLNASTFYCPSNVSSYYTGLLEQVLIDQGFRCYKMPSFEATPSSTTLLEGVPLSLSVTMTSAMVDRCLGEVCQVEISLMFDDPVTTSCSSGEGIQQILTDRCFAHFTTNTSGITHAFHLHGRLDHKVQTDHNVTVSLTARLVEDGNVFGEQTVGQVRLSVVNRDTSGLCSMIAQPTIVTFDRIEYMSFGKGEYLVYQHSSLPEKVNVRFQSCGGALTSCPCGVMVQSGDDVYILDACRRIGQSSQPLTFRIYRNGDYTPHSQVYYDVNGLATQFVLPSGMIVFVRLVEEDELDVWLHPTGLDWNNTLGLCGTFDGNADNEFTYPDSTVESLTDIQIWRDSLLPFDFLKAWKQDSTLMYGVPEDSGFETRNNTLCQCLPEFGGCMPVDLVETCDFISGTDYTELLSVFEVDQVASQQRRKRQVVSEFDESDVEIDQLPTTWPTPSNISRSDAEQFCEITITSAGFWNVCSSIVDTTNIFQSCLDRILLADSYSAVATTLEGLRIQCRTAIFADPGLSVDLNMTYEILVPYVLNVTCSRDCNGNGECQNGECVCDSGYKGDDCALKTSYAPVLASLSENLYTSSSATGNMVVTRVIEVYGNSFTNTDTLLCHMEEVKMLTTGFTRTGMSSAVPATFLTAGSVRCEVTGSLPLTGLLMTVSNNGLNQSNGLLYIVQDGVCYDCSATDEYCNIQPTSCIIDNTCYAAGQYRNSCFVCDPITNDLQYKTSPTCPGASTTTTIPTPSSTSTTSSRSPSPDTEKPSSSTSSTTSPAPPTTSSTPSPSSSASSSTSSTPLTTRSTPSTTSQSTSTSEPSPTTSSEGGSEGQGKEDDNDDDDQLILIVVISVAGVIVMVVVATVVCIACRLKRTDRRRMKESMSTSQTPSTELVKARRGDGRLQGRLNPYFQEVEFATAHGRDQPAVPRRAAPAMSAPFNPQGLLQGERVSGRAYESSGGMHEINIGLFEDGRKQQSKRPTHGWEEVGYKIPRPAVEAVYDVSHGSSKKDRMPGGNVQHDESYFTHL